MRTLDYNRMGTGHTGIARFPKKSVLTEWLVPGPRWEHPGSHPSLNPTRAWGHHTLWAPGQGGAATGPRHPYRRRHLRCIGSYW